MLVFLFSVNFITTADVTIGTGSTSITVAHVNINTATNSHVATGTLKTELTGATTNVVIQTDSKVRFLASAFHSIVQDWWVVQEAVPG